MTSFSPASPSSSTASDAVLIVVPVTASLLMAYRARKKKSLTPAGCWTALGVGVAIGVLGGGGTAMIEHFLCSFPREALVIGEGSGKINVMLRNLLHKTSASSSQLAKKLVDSAKNKINVDALSANVSNGNDLIPATITTKANQLTEKIARAKEVASNTTAFAKNTASRVLDKNKNKLSSIFLKRDENGSVIEGSEPKQLLPFLSLINFFFTSTYLTKKGAAIKKREIKVVEEDVYEASGNRTATQVLCNGGVAAGLAVIVHCCRVLRHFGFFDMHHMLSATAEASSGGGGGCEGSSPTISAASCFASHPLAFAVHYLATIPNTVLCLALIAQIAAAQGDTWSSELGVLSKSPHAYLIVGGRRVPKGTNGGITVLGTAAAVGAGLQLGITLAAAQVSTIVISALCRGDVSTTAAAQYLLVEAVKVAIPWRTLFLARAFVNGVRAFVASSFSPTSSDSVVGIETPIAASSGGGGGFVLNEHSGPLRPAVVPIAVTAQTLVTTCLLAAIGGSLFDSVLGQFLQETKERRGNPRETTITPTNDSPEVAPISNDNEPSKAEEQEFPASNAYNDNHDSDRHVTGVNLLSNHGVNFLTTLFVTVSTVVILHRKPLSYV